MLSYQVFNEVFAGLLCPRFRISTDNPVLIDAYYESFKDFSDESFRQISKIAFGEEFLPSPKWFYEQRFYLAEKARRESSNETLAIQSDSDRELENMTAEQCYENLRRMKALMNGVARMPSRKSTEKPQPDRFPDIAQEFQDWLMTQPVIANAPEQDRSSLIRIMSSSPRFRSEFMEDQEW